MPRMALVVREERSKLKTILEDDLVRKNVSFDVQKAFKDPSVDKLFDATEKKKEKKIRNNFEATKEVFDDYTANSSVHGIQYLGNPSVGISLMGKLIWLFVMIAGLICLISLVTKFWSRFEHNPTSIYVKSFNRPLFTAPFPAVTSCPFVPSLLRTRLKLMKSLRFPANMTSEQQMFYLKYGSDLARANIPGRDDYLVKYKQILKINDLQLVDFLRLIRPCDDLFESCWWHGKRINCKEHLTLTYSVKGLCCSFNYLLEDYIRAESEAEKPEPVHTSAFGELSGLTLVFRPELFLNDDGTGPMERMSTNTIGILVYNHHHLDYPGENYPMFFLQRGQELHISVKPEYRQKPPHFYHFRKEWGQLDPECIKNDEGNLKFLPVYRYKNCYTDCKIDMSYRTCGCIPHYYTPVAEKRKIRTCQLEDFPCLDEHAKSIRIVKDVYLKNFTCTCRNPCDHMIYDEKSSVLELEATKFANTPVYRNVSTTQAILKVYMNAEVYMWWETRPTADALYFLSSVGGIYSLCLGCSFLSAVEVFYFAILLLRNLSRK